MSTVWPRGSEWRRWDLHVHTPGTALNDQFSSWEEFLARVEGAGDTVAVVGVTDYLSIAGYRRVKAERDAGRLANIMMVLPNVEFRISPETKAGSGINIHLLISPDGDGHVERIERALQRLTFAFDGQPFGCFPEDLIRLGRMSKKDLSDEAAYREGVNQFKVSFERFVEWRSADAWLMRNSLVALATGSKDGVGGITHDHGFKLVRQEILRAADLLFSPKPSDISYFLGRGKDPEDEVVRQYGGLKPCVHGSDAHQLDKVFEPEERRYCWIKADPTFEGLRQTLYEPAARVHIGPTPPSSAPAPRVIQSVEVKGSESFGDLQVPVNSGLVAIIGNKGAGKSALAELIALGAGAWELSSNSFLAKAGKQAHGLSVNVKWGDGAETAGEVGSVPEKGSPKARYLSQDFVEELCSRDLDANKLVKEIERVVFGFIGEADRLGSSDFGDLLRRRTERHVERRRSLLTEIRDINARLAQMRSEVSDLPRRKERIAELDRETQSLAEALAGAGGAAEQSAVAELEAWKAKRRDIVSQVSAQRSRLESVESVENRVLRFEEQMARFFEEVRPTLVKLGFLEHEIALFKPAFCGNTGEPLSRVRRDAEDEVARLAGDPSAPVGGTVAEAEARILEVEKRVSADAERARQLLELQGALEAVRKERGSTADEVARVEGEVAPNIELLKTRRLQAYADLVRSLSEEAAVLQELHAPLQKHLASGELHERNLDFFVRWEPLLGPWVNRLEGMVDQRRAGPFRDRGAIEAAVRQDLEPAWRSGSADACRGAVAALGARFEAMPDACYRSGNTLRDVEDVLFDLDHLKLRYGVKYEGTPLEALSPGTRGLVLLILYLAMDRDDGRPLIIDQPEENLDNQSICDALVPYFTRAKGRRQVILVTHNPNLVVNTDAEQVVVAYSQRMARGQLPRFTYKMGSLEDSKGQRAEAGIRERVCDVLEGGARAFERRERKYRMRADR